MEINKIEELLATYYEGQTSLEEEETLRRYFSGSEIPEHLQPDKDLFLGMANEKSQAVLGPEFELDILKAIQDSEIKEKDSRKSISRQLYWISGVAASFILLIATYFFLQSNSLQDTYDNPQLAYNETKKILSYVSNKMNKGLDPVQESLYTYNVGTSELSRLSKINEGMDDVKSISKLYEKAYPLEYLNFLNKPGEIITSYTKK